MKIRFTSWNVNNRRLTTEHIQILRDVAPQVLALQEVSASFYEGLQAAALFEWDTFSLTLRKPTETEGRSRRLGCAVFGNQPLRLLTSSLVPDLDFPERALVATTQAQPLTLPLTVCSFHIPPGASWGKIKPRTLATIARWLPLQSTPLLFGIDANCPKLDHPDISQNEWWWSDERLLLGPSPLHQLKDAYRVYLDDAPEEWSRILAERPDGPLAVSHVRGNSRKRTECRYDFIYVSDEVRVEKVAYAFTDDIKAVSDHALVIADLTIELPNNRLC